MNAADPRLAFPRPSGERRNPGVVRVSELPGCGGFTLIELVLVILVMGIGFVALGALYVQVTDTLGSNEDLQTSAQLAQGCAEHVLATRRNLGFTAPALATTTICNGLPTVAGYTRTVAPSATYVGGIATACPNGATCRDVTVTVSRGTVNTPVRLLLVQ